MEIVSCLSSDRNQVFHRTLEDDRSEEGVVKDVVYLIVSVHLLPNIVSCHFEPVAFWQSKNSCKIEFPAQRSDGVLLFA